MDQCLIHSTGERLFSSNGIQHNAAWMVLFLPKKMPLLPLPLSLRPRDEM
uniref:Uncharacterized protein n=1 Tax=Arundo donax TaxID=35708 RepID=A0A0A8ZX11_ARUDO